MGLSSRVGATALVSLAALSSVVNAQGFYFQNPKICNTKFQYLGCANVEYEPFAFAPTNWDPKVSADNSASYIDYDTGDLVNSTVTPYFCSQACEAHGFKYSAVWFERSCTCGSSLKIKTPNTYNDLDLNTVLDRTGDAKCTAKKGGGPPDPCGGDRRQNCGSDQGAQIYVNPSFQNTASVTTASLVSGYQQLGCFKNARFPSRTYTTTDLDNSGACFTYCANLGSPFVTMVKKALSGGLLGVECHCGAGFSEDAQQSPDGATCNAKCSAVLDSTTCDAGSQDCCQLIGGTSAPVYYNPTLLGCLVPVIPGQTDPPVDSNVPFNGYKCFATPAAILNRPVVSIVYDARTIAASATFVATASPSPIATPYVNYGCWQNTPVADIFNNVAQSNIAANQITVEKCVAYCASSSVNLPYAALYGSGADQKCVCGDSKKANVPDTTNRMQDCNQPCGGTSQQNCGGTQGPLIYAKLGQPGNNWAVQWSSTRSATPVYACAGGPTPPVNTPSDTPSNTPSDTPSVTPTGSDNPTGSPTGTPSGSDNPTGSPTGSGSDNPTGSPTGSGSDNPTGSPTGSDSGIPTGTGTGTGTGSGTGATPTSTTPGVPGTTNLPANTFVILQVVPYTPTKKRALRNQRRQSVGGFVGGAGPSNPNSCDDATLFGVRSGQLLSGGQPVSTDPGVDFIPFAVNPTGSIKRTFTIIDGKLHWYNDLFLDGEAHFCQVNNGDVFITFNGDEFGPIDCTRIDIVVYYANQCVDGDVIGTPGVNPSGSGGVPTSTGGGSSPTGGSGDDDDDVPDKDWYFREGHAPDNYPCSETTESWIPGEPTFLPHEEL